MTPDLPTAADPIRVVAADDHPLWRAALTRALERQEGLEVTATAQDGQEALEAIREHQPDVAVLDVRMPLLDGLDVSRRVRGLDLGTRVLFLSEYSTGDLVLQALTAGGSGYLTKSAPIDEICAAIRTVHEGGSVLPDAVGTELAGVLRDRGDGGVGGGHLTPREISVLELVSEGCSAREIGERLHLAVPTIKTHLANVYAKLGVNDRGAAVAEGIRRGLLS
jgi:two-component system, NarL family, nitrate/nitrite response regulator NarL